MSVSLKKRMVLPAGVGIVILLLGVVLSPAPVRADADFHFGFGFGVPLHGYHGGPYHHHYHPHHWRRHHPGPYHGYYGSWFSVPYYSEPAPRCRDIWIEGHWERAPRYDGGGFTTYVERWVDGYWEKVCN